MPFVFEDFLLDRDRRELRRGNTVVAAEPKVFDLLVHLFANRERVVSKDDLIAAVWDGRIVSDAALATAINAARVALGDSGEAQRLIRTLPRKGFRFVGEVREQEAAGAPADVTRRPRRTWRCPTGLRWPFCLSPASEATPSRIILPMASSRK